MSLSNVVDTAGLEQFGRGTINPLKETDVALAQAISAVNDSKEDLFRYSVMPTPGETYENKVVQYIGTSNNNYIKGHFYVCEENSENETYFWRELSSNISFTEYDIIDIEQAFDDGYSTPIPRPGTDGTYVTTYNQDGSIASIVFTFSGGTVTTTYSKSGTSEITQELTVLTGATTGKLVTTTTTGNTTTVTTTYVPITNGGGE